MAMQRKSTPGSSGVAEPPVKLPEALRQRIRSLERESDWDGQDADPITADTCGAALQFLERVLSIKPDLPLPFPAPSVYGAVSLLWVKGDRDLAIQVYSPNRVESYFQQPDGRYASVPESPKEAIRRVLAFDPEQQ